MGGGTREVFYYPKGTIQVAIVGKDINEGEIHMWNCQCVLIKLHQTDDSKCRTVKTAAMFNSLQALTHSVGNILLNSTSIVATKKGGICVSNTCGIMLPSLVLTKQVLQAAQLTPAFFTVSCYRAHTQTDAEHTVVVFGHTGLETFTA